MHRRTTLDTSDHKIIKLDHIGFFFLFSEGRETLQDRQIRIDHRSEYTEKYDFLPQSDRSLIHDEVLDIVKKRLLFIGVFAIFDVEDDDVLIGGCWHKVGGS
jgi:hypothetical protein